MNATSKYASLQQLLGDRNIQFWLMHIGGWAGLSVVTYLSLNLLYNQPEIAYLLHNITQSLLGIIVSWPMRHVYRAIWTMPWGRRLALIIATVLGLAAVWAIGRLLLFEALTEESGLWSEFGGWLFPSIFIFLCWTALYHGAKYYQLLQAEHRSVLALSSLRQQESLKLAQAESEARNAQLTMLRYQLNPHFLFNTLNAISSLVSMRHNEQANTMIIQLSEFLRYSLESDPLQPTSLAKEIEAIDLYLKIEQTRFGERLRVNKNIDATALEQRIPGLLLQPLVENAIKYAIAPAEEGGEITINGRVTGAQLWLEVADSGPGYDNSGEAHGAGIGLRNTQERLAALYDDDFEVIVGRSELGGASIAVRIPCEIALERTA